MNDMTRSFGFIFRDDLLFGTAGWPYDEHYEAAPTPHPAVQHVPWFDFAVSCSIEPGWSWGRAAILQTGLWNMPPDYHMSNYHPVPQHCPEMRCGAFIQAWTTRYGKGRVMAFTDSTIFSNFCLFQPGKINLLLDMVEWLNHGSAWIDPAPWLGLLGLIVLVAGGWIARAGQRPGSCCWPASCADGRLGELASGAVQRRAEPLPPVLRPQLCVVIDRTASRVPLAQGAFNEDKEGLGFGLLEQWISRLGCYTVRANDAAALAGDALVVICPSRPVDPAFCDGLARYVDGGGRVLVIDSPENANSTADSLLRPFGLSFLRRQPREGASGVGRFLAGSCGRSGLGSGRGAADRLAWPPARRRRRAARQGPGHGDGLRLVVERRRLGQRLVGNAGRRDLGPLRRAVCHVATAGGGQADRPAGSPQGRGPVAAAIPGREQLAAEPRRGRWCDRNRGVQAALRSPTPPFRRRLSVSRTACRAGRRGGRTSSAPSSARRASTGRNREARPRRPD